MRKKNNSGFTLMEMLIVVAIIAVLIAVAIPTFSSSLTKATKATDMANIRAAYSMAQQCTLLETTPVGTDSVMSASEETFYMQQDGSFSKETTGRNDYVIKADAEAADTVAGKSGWEEGDAIVVKHALNSKEWDIDFIN